MSPTTVVKPDAPESKLWNIPPGLLSYHYETTPPTIDQLEHAQAFFERNPKEFMYSSPKFKLMDFDESPEVCFLGRSNVGKSSLMNAILDKQMAKTSFKPGKTRMLNLFVVGPKHGRPEDKLVILDTPGYGHGSRDDWGVQIMKYLEKRRQLKMAFLLIDATHGMKNSDHQLIKMFRERRIPFQVVFSKVDRMLFDQKSTPRKVVLEDRIANLQEEMMNVRRVIDPRKGEHGWEPWMDEEESIGKRYGVDAVRFAMLKAAGLEQAPVLGKVRLQEIVPFDQISGFNE
ncbi:P-loop containing nucleoside triphosphate hydrolase protein [Bisporella sp. PMI_857]|nr:P-loop containing nucleoside triphosphate hydrolase protein [Bisporella sp. PMI_857]